MNADPAATLQALGRLQEHQDLSKADKITLAVEEASILFARGHYAEALLPLERMLEGGQRLPGQVYLLAGLSYLALQRFQESRQSFTALLTAARDDPAALWARYYLGRIALESGNTVLAIGYFESAEKSPWAAREPCFLAGICQALQQEQREVEADTKRQELLSRFPQSLAALQLQQQPVSPVAEPVVVPEVPGELPEPGSPSQDSFCLQLAAFADRGRALTYLASWQRDLPNLRLDEEPGPQGQLLYKVRTGRFASRRLAQTEAERLRRVHGLEVLLVEGGW
jgi:tetratricopeptide (TPR) repeat protein